jgi:hypothetical protein
MSRILIDELLKKYSKPELAVIRSTFFVVNHVIDTYLLNAKPFIEVGLSGIRKHGPKCAFHQDCAKEAELPEFQHGFEMGLAYGLTLIRTDNLNTIATVEAAIKEGISRG